MPLQPSGTNQRGLMKLLHIADLHIGKTVNGFPMLEDQRHALAQVLAIAERENVDALLLAGDIYDKSAPSAEAVALVDWLLCEVAKRSLPCFAIPGNHDSAERVAYAAGPLALQGIHMAPLFDGLVKSVEMQDEFGSVTFWLLPFLKPANVRRHFPDADIGTDYTAALRTVIDACDIDETQRNVLLCHQFVTWNGSEPERSDSELSVGGLDNVDASVFERFDYVALGHIHRPQRIGRDSIRYAGSLLKYSASETEHVKGATIIALGAKPESGTCSIDISLAPIEPLHDMRKVKGPLSELIDPAIAESADREDYLHVTLTDEEPAIDALARLRAVYPNVMSLEYERKRQRAAVETPAALDDEEALDPMMLFARFFEERTGTALSDQQEKLAFKAMHAQMAAESEGTDVSQTRSASEQEGGRR